MHIKSLVKKIFYPTPEKILGVDIGFDRIKIVQIDMKATPKPEITDYALMDLPTELRGTGLTAHTEEMGTFLAEIINKHGFSAKDVVFSIGGRNAFVRGITMPPMTDEEMRQAVIWDSAQYVPYENDTYYVDFAKYGDLDKEGQQPVVLVASPKEVVDALVNVGESLNLNILKLDIDVLSTYRAIGDSYSDFILLDLGRNYSLMTIFQKGAPVAQRSIPAGAMSFAKIIAEKMQIPVADALDTLSEENLLGGDAPEDTSVRVALQEEVNELVKECRRTSDYYILNKKDASFTNLILTGSGAMLVGLADFMNEQLDIKVTIFNILDVVNFDSRFEKKKVQQSAPTLTVAVGAAMAGGVDND